METDEQSVLTVENGLWRHADAMSWGFRPVVVGDCVGDRALGPHEASLFDMAQKYASVLDRDPVLEQLAAS